MIAPKHRIGYIDGLRAVAVLSVVLFHVAVRSGLNQYGWIADILRNGTRGVDLFFVISGFCLSYPTLVKLRANGDATFDVARYAAHRIVRIVPPYWAAIIFTLVLAFTLTHVGYDMPGGVPKSGISALALLGHAVFLDLNTGFINPVFWTLPIEFRWYFVFPVVLMLWVKSPKAFGVVAVIALVLLATRAANLDVVYLPEFMLGIVAAEMRIRRVKLSWLAFPATIMLIIVAAIAGIGKGWGADFQDFDPLWFIASFGVVVCCGRFEFLEWLLSASWLRATGIASYSIYLVSVPVIWVCASRGMSPPMYGLSSIAAGFLFWLVIERPFVSEPIRIRLVAEFQNTFTKWIPRLSVTSEIPLESSRLESLATNSRQQKFPSRSQLYKHE